jgi:hypothetical protein
MVGACAVDLEYDSVPVGRQGRKMGEAPGGGGPGGQEKNLLSLFALLLEQDTLGFFSHFFRGNRTPEFSFHSAYGRSDRSPENEVSAGLNRARSFHRSTRRL